MLLKEFIERTGFTPTEEYYTKVIEPEYMASELDKDQFCKQWKRNGGIQKAYNALKNDLASSSTDVLNLHQTLNKYKEILAKAGDMLDDERQESKVLQKELNNQNEAHSMLIAFLIEQADQPNATSIRNKAIELLGEKQYLKIKIEKGIELNEADKAMLLNIL